MDETQMHKLQNRVPRANVMKTGCKQKSKRYHHESTAVWTGMTFGAKVAWRGAATTSTDEKIKSQCVCAETQENQRQSSHVC